MSIFQTVPRGSFYVDAEGLYDLRSIQAAFRRFGWTAWMCGRLDAPLSVCVEGIPEIKLASILRAFPGATYAVEEA